MLKPAKQAKHSFLHSIAMAAVLPVEPEQGTYQKEIAIVRAHLETCDPQSWSADPEQACVRHRIFLSVFLKRDLKKTQVKEKNFWSLGKASSIPSLIAGVTLQNAVVLRKPAGSPMKKPAAGNKNLQLHPKPVQGKHALQSLLGPVQGQLCKWLSMGPGKLL